MPLRPKYPEAPGKASHYGSLVNKLTGYQNSISKSINSTRYINTAAIVSSRVDGEYYDRYLDKKDNWIDRHRQIIKKFDRFLNDLQSCINAASKKRDMWKNRIPMMEYYEVT